jgi:hypothetical protein
VGSSLAGEYSADYNTPRSESKAASDLTEQRFGGYSGQEIYVVWKDAAGAESPGARERVNAFLADARKVDHIAEQTTTRVSRDGTIGSTTPPLDREVPMAPFMPVMMFAILFGLSMDYEVFLISRTREEYLKHGDTSRAVADGLAKTARVITAAAAIMVVVFLAFLAAPDTFLKLFGIGLASAIFLDAAIVRMALVPAVMQLLGSRNWWIPDWLERTLPRLDVEGVAVGAAQGRP